MLNTCISETEWIVRLTIRCRLAAVHKHYSLFTGCSYEGGIGFPCMWADVRAWAIRNLYGNAVFFLVRARVEGEMLRFLALQLVCCFPLSLTEGVFLHTFAQTLRAYVP